VTAILHLYIGQFLSKLCAAHALSELFGSPLSEGAVAAMTTRAAGGIDQFTELVRERIADASVAGFDETGLRVVGALHWGHCAHRQVHADHLPPKRGRLGHRQRRVDRVQQCCRARCLGPI